MYGTISVKWKAALWYAGALSLLGLALAWPFALDALYPGSPTLWLACEALVALAGGALAKVVPRGERLLGWLSFVVLIAFGSSVFFLRMPRTLFPWGVAISVGACLGIWFAGFGSRGYLASTSVVAFVLLGGVFVALGLASWLLPISTSTAVYFVVAFSAALVAITLFLRNERSAGTR